MVKTERKPETEQLSRDLLAARLDKAIHAALSAGHRICPKENAALMTVTRWSNERLLRAAEHFEGLVTKHT